MVQFLVRRLALFMPMIVVMSIVAFAIIQAPPGDFLTDYIAQLQSTGEQVDESELLALKKRYGLDKPIYVQYYKWAVGFFKWDLGLSIEFRRPVTDLVNERLMMTLALGVFTILFTWTMAIPIGILSAWKQYSVMDYIFTVFSYFGVGTPNFLLALVIMWFVFDWFGWRITGLFSEDYNDAPWSFGKFYDMLKHIWVPMIILGTDGAARFTRIVRANLLDEMSRPYVETARAKGLPEWKLLMKYPVRLALNPFVSTAGLELPRLISGSLIVATVMSLPTIGPLLLRALLSQDMYMAGSIVMILTFLTLVGVLISDIILALLDPRIRMGS